MFWGREAEVQPCSFFNLGPKLGCVVKHTPQQLQPQKKTGTHFTGGEVVWPRASLDGYETRTSVMILNIEIFSLFYVALHHLLKTEYSLCQGMTSRMDYCHFCSISRSSNFEFLSGKPDVIRIYAISSFTSFKSCLINTTCPPFCG